MNKKKKKKLSDEEWLAQLSEYDREQFKLDPYYFIKKEIAEEGEERLSHLEMEFDFYLNRPSIN